MKAKKLKEALQQMSEEGVVQVFRPRDGAPALVGVVGPLQLDVLKARLDAEYSLPVEFEVSEFQLARWISCDDKKKLEAFISANGSGVADDVDGDPVFLAKNEFYLGYTKDRAIADEAYAGDVVGIPNHGTLRIGDTLTEGEDLNFVGVPSFAPEILRRVPLTDAMKPKKLREALQQMSEEGVVQVFRPRDGAPALVGVVGPLQLDVLKARLDAEYSLPVEFEVSEFQLARWISSDDRKKLDAFISANGSGVADDVDGDPVFLAKNEFYLGYTKERAEGIVFSNVKDVKKKA
jgi:peptide subunit release factor RF-3